MNNKGSVGVQVLGALAIAVVAFLAGLLLGGGAPAGAPFSEVVTPVLFADVVTLDGELSFGSANCVSRTWNPGNVNSSTVATTTVELDSGFTAGDLLFFGFSATTSDVGEPSLLVLNVGLTGATSSYALAQLSMQNIGQLAVDAATGTLSVCYADVP